MVKLVGQRRAGAGDDAISRSTPYPFKRACISDRAKYQTQARTVEEQTTVAIAQSREGATAAGIDVLAGASTERSAAAGARQLQRSSQARSEPCVYMRIVAHDVLRAQPSRIRFVETRSKASSFRVVPRSTPGPWLLTEPDLHAVDAVDSQPRPLADKQALRVE
jgi:hypothetical protein